jgi:hypothetical protein
MNTIIDRGENDPIPFDLSPKEREDAAFAQAQLRMDAMAKNAKGMPTNVIPMPMTEARKQTPRDIYLQAEQDFLTHNKDEASHAD